MGFFPQTFYLVFLFLLFCAAYALGPLGVRFNLSLMFLFLLGFHIYAFLSSRKLFYHSHAKELKGHDPYDIFRIRKKLNWKFKILIWPSDSVQCWGCYKTFFITQGALDHLSFEDKCSIFYYQKLSFENKIPQTFTFFASVLNPLAHLAMGCDKSLKWVFQAKKFLFFQNLTESFLKTLLSMTVPRSKVFLQDQRVFSRYKNWPHTLIKIQSCQNTRPLQHRDFLSALFLVPTKLPVRQSFPPSTYERLERLTGFRTF